MADPKQLRVVFTGHAGLAKEKVLSRLCAEFQDNNPRKLARTYVVESGILNMSTFLKQGRSDQQLAWQRSLITSIQEWQSATPKPDYAFLSMHLSYYWHSHVFSPLSWRMRPAISRRPVGEHLEDTLVKWVCRTFRPNYFVTLIDDIQAVQARIKTHHFLLRDLLKWRNMEVMLTDILSKMNNVPGPACDEALFPYEHSPVVAIRHPSKMLYRYLTEPRTIRIYASFTIGEPRRAAPAQRAEMTREINEFRSRLSAEFTVFDPLTIDELPIKGAYDQQTKDGAQPDKIQLSASEQWNIPAEETLCDEPRRDAEFERQDVHEVATRAHSAQKTEIERHVEQRDQRLIDQSDCLVIYRPTYNKEEAWSAGTKHEAYYAFQTGKPILVIHDPAVDGVLAPDTLGIELAHEDYYDKTPNLTDPERQREALDWLVNELKRRAPQWVAARMREA